MLFVLTEQIREKLPATLKKRDLRDALSNIARAHYEGKHAVSGPHSLLRALGEEVSLPEDIRGMYKEIHRGRLEANSLRKSLSCVVEVGLDTGSIRQRQADGQLVFQVPLSYFADSERAQACRLVAEDADDAHVYSKATEAYVSATFHGITVRLDPFGGGGDSTADALRDHAAHGPTIAVVDADHKWSPSEGERPEGQTARAARRTAKELTKQALCAVHAIPCREMENLFPASLVQSCVVRQDSQESVERLERAVKLGFFAGDDDSRCFDLKKGLCWREVLSRPERTPQRRYLDRVFARLRDDVPSPEDGWCGEQPRCEDAKRCTCVLVHPLEWLTRRVAPRIKEGLSTSEVAEHFYAPNSPHSEVWTDLGKTLFAWGCAYPRKRLGRGAPPPQGRRISPASVTTDKG